MKGLFLFAVISLVLIAVAAIGLSLVFIEPGAPRAIRASAVTAWVVQLFTFAIARGMARSNFIAGWAIGMVLRFVTLVVYALVIIEAMGFALGPALISLATFFFISTLVEPPLLKV